MTLFVIPVYSIFSLDRDRVQEVGSATRITPANCSQTLLDINLTNRKDLIIAASYRYTLL